MRLQVHLRFLEVASGLKAPDGANGWFRGLNRFKLDLS